MARTGPSSGKGPEAVARVAPRDGIQRGQVLSGSETADPVFDNREPRVGAGQLQHTPGIAQIGIAHAG